MSMRFYDAFAGVGGFHLGITRAHPGWECVGACEWDKHCQAVYSRRFPGVGIDGDIRQLDRLPEGTEMLCGGFPCQPFSIAGKRKGLNEERGTLFGELARLAERSKPRLLFLENVKGLLSAQDGYCFAHILSRLDELGYFVEWQVLNSKDFGVPQNRERVFIIGHLGGEPASKVFPLGEGGKVADGVAGEAQGYDTNDNRPEIGEANRVYGLAGVAPPAKSHPTLILSHSPRSGDPEKGGTGPLVSSEHCFTLDSTPHLMIHGGVWRRGEFGDGMKEECSFTLDRTCGRDLLIPSASRIRRLTPRECNRLQGFPDDWDRYGSDGKEVSDSQRYRMMGNAVTVNVIEAVARRLE